MIGGISRNFAAFGRAIVWRAEKLGIVDMHLKKEWKSSACRVLLVSLALSTAAQASAQMPAMPKHQVIQMNKDVMVVVEAASVSKSGDIVSANVVTMPAENRPYGGQAVYTITGLAEVNCRTTEVRYKRLSYRGSKSNLLGADNNARPWAKISKDTPAQLLHDYICLNSAKAGREFEASVPLLWKLYQDMLKEGKL